MVKADLGRLKASVMVATAVEQAWNEKWIHPPLISGGEHIRNIYNNGGVQKTFRLQWCWIDWFLLVCRQVLRISWFRCLGRKHDKEKGKYTDSNSGEHMEVDHMM